MNPTDVVEGIVPTVPNPKYEKLSDKDSELFIMATMTEMADKKEGQPSKPELAAAVDDNFLIQILDKRIEVLKLPIKFTTPAKMAILAFVDRPGSLVALLVDCLNNYEGKTVDVAMLTNLYPWGWYDEETFIRYVDEYLKPKKVKWAEIY